MVRNNHNASQGGNNSSSTMVDPSQVATSPFYIHPNENPAVILISPPFNCRNYHSWSRLMKRAMVLKIKHRFLDDAIPIPDRFDPSFAAWERCNNLVHSWILSSVIPSIAQSLIYIKSAARVWRNLRERFSQGDLVRVTELRQELHSFKQNSLSVSDHYTEIRVLSEELDNYRPIKDCSCPVKCNCDLRNVLIYKEQDEVIGFLMGLNDSFGVVKSQILLMDPLPPMNRVFSMVFQHERQNGLEPNNEDNHVMVNVVDGRRSYGRGRGNGKLCLHCGKIGHTIDTCFKKHGFPPTLSSDGRGRGFGSNANCTFNEEEVESKEEDVSPVREKIVPSLSQEEYRKLMSLLQSNSLKVAEPPISHLVNHINSNEEAAAHVDQGIKGCSYEADWFM